MHDYTLMFCFCLTAAVNNNRLKSSFCSLVTEQKICGNVITAWFRFQRMILIVINLHAIYITGLFQDFQELGQALTLPMLN